MRFRAGLALVAFAALFVPYSASAHIYQTDGTLKALLHINPDDQPVAGQSSGLLFTLTDTSNRFRAQLCDCRISINDGSHTLLDRPLIDGEALSEKVIRVNYTFLYQSSYQVTLAGSPVQADAFLPFKLVYNVRVDRGTVKSPPPPLLTWAILVLGGAAVVSAGHFVVRELRHGSGH